MIFHKQIKINIKLSNNKWLKNQKNKINKKFNNKI